MTRHASRCRSAAFVNDRLDHEGEVIDRTTLQCLTCGAWLGMGPSKDDGEHAEAVAVEGWAARVAATGKPSTCSTTHHDADCTECGWDDHGIYCPDDARMGWYAGYLARCIYEHDEGMTEAASEEDA